MAQVVLGMVLGPILERSFMVSAIKSRWNMLAFFERPIALGLALATVVVIVVGVKATRRRPHIGAGNGAPLPGGSD